jgi:hypothetical protein
MSIRAVLFDLDGTLLDTLEDLADSMNEVLRGMSYPGHDLAHYRQAVGDGVEQLALRSLPPSARHPSQVRQALIGMRAVYAVRWQVNSRPYAGISELLDELTRRTLLMAVLSNKPEDFTRRMVEHILGRWSFASVRGARPGEALKPDPAGRWASPGNAPFPRRTGFIWATRTSICEPPGLPHARHRSRLGVSRGRYALGRGRGAGHRASFGSTEMDRRPIEEGG